MNICKLLVQKLQKIEVFWYSKTSLVFYSINETGCVRTEKPDRPRWVISNQVASELILPPVRTRRRAVSRKLRCWRRCGCWRWRWRWRWCGCWRWCWRRSCGASSWGRDCRSTRCRAAAARCSPCSVSSLSAGTASRRVRGCRAAGTAGTAAIYKGTRVARTAAAAGTRVKWIWGRHGNLSPFSFMALGLNFH